MIGIIAGVGPLAGLDILTKIIQETNATSDQEHIPVLFSSQPHRITARTAFLLDKKNPNPAYAIVEIIRQLETIGARVIGIPCITTHAAPIFEVIMSELDKVNSQVKVVHMIEQTVNFIKTETPYSKIGILSTNEIKNAELFTNYLEQNDLSAIHPSTELQERVHASIYDETYGIRAISDPVSNRVRQELLTFLAQLKKDGAQTVILGGVEFPLAIHDKENTGIPIIDPNRILARALIKEYDATKLRPL